MFSQKPLISIATVSILLTLNIQSALCRSTAPAKSSVSTVKPSVYAKKHAISDEEAIRAQLTALKNYVIRGDAKGMAALWTKDGQYIDEEGNESRGQGPLENTFASLLKESQNKQVEISAEDIRKLSKDTAIATGTVKQKQGVDSVPVTKFSMVLVKANDNWQIASATETPIVATTTSTNPLKPLEWLIGDWSSEKNGATVNMKAEWVPSHNFIFCRYEIKQKDSPHRIESQIIGWDPRSQSPISWHFDSAGGFGQGNWIKHGNGWMIEATGVDRDGSVTNSTNIYQPSATGSFLWQSVNRSIDGTPVADTAPLTVHRITQ